MSKDSRVLNEPPKRSILEEVGNAVTHGVGALFGIAGLVLLLVKSDTSAELFCTLVYGLCLVIMFLMSCLYHSFRWGSRVKRLWRRFAGKGPRERFCAVSSGQSLLPASSSWQSSVPAGPKRFISPFSLSWGGAGSFSCPAWSGKTCRFS